MSIIRERQLIEIIEQCQLKKLISLIRLGRNIRWTNEFGQNFLTLIVQKQRFESDIQMKKKRFRLFRYLINEENLEIDKNDVFGKDILSWSTHLNCTRETMFLLKSFPGGLELLKLDQFGCSPLHYAIEHGNEQVVQSMIQYFLRYSIRFDVRDAFNNSPVELAKKLDFENLSKLLTQASSKTVFLSRELPEIKTAHPFFGRSRSETRDFPYFSNLSNNFNLIERRIYKAKITGDWKQVALLRKTKEIPLTESEKNLPEVRQSIGTNRTVISSITSNQTERIFEIFQTQITSSFRPAFLFDKPRVSTTNFPNLSNLNDQRRDSSRRLSTISGPRQRDSQASLNSVPNLQERLSIASISKQQRPSVAQIH